MNQRSDKYERLLAFLLHNMKEMEIELRAQSIVFEALEEKIVGPNDLGNALISARNSTGMLEFVAEKYSLLEKLYPGPGSARTLPEFEAWGGFNKPDTLPN